MENHPEITSTTFTAPDENGDVLFPSTNSSFKPTILTNKANNNLDHALLFYGNPMNSNPMMGFQTVNSLSPQPTSLGFTTFHYSPSGYSPQLGNSLEPLYNFGSFSPPSLFPNSTGSNGTSPNILRPFPTTPSPPVMMGTEPSGPSQVQPLTMYRNLFHAVECTLPFDKSQMYEGWRLFIDEEVGYAGNAKIFKRMPDKEEKALILSCKILDPNKKPLEQCRTCHEYFENRDYFKANPHIKGRITLVKCNNIIKIENGSFKVSMKYMCCCKHHMIPHYLLALEVRENVGNTTVGSVLYPIYVKQWRKSTQKKQSCSLTLT